jgi:serine/threonine-protein kinase
VFKARQTLGKYRISGLIGSGGFAAVYRARDTVEGIPVALKIPHAHLVDKDTLGPSG